MIILFINASTSLSSVTSPPAARGIYLLLRNNNLALWMVMNGVNKALVITFVNVVYKAVISFHRLNTAKLFTLRVSDNVLESLLQYALKC